MTGLPDYMKINELYLSGMSTTSKQSKVQMNLKQLKYLWKQLNQSVHNSDKQTTVNNQQTIPMYNTKAIRQTQMSYHQPTKQQVLAIKSKYQHPNDEASSTMELGCLNLKFKAHM